MIQRGEFDKIVPYIVSTGFQADYMFIIQNLVRVNPNGAAELAKRLALHEGGSLIDINAAVDVFMSMNRVQEASAFLLEALKADRKEDGFLQTRLMEINLVSNPSVSI